ncbi:MAG: hypothetical protein R3325_07020 [Thermoanaerobaculia bacterium]|nr:hypothetical protein [Thermoanaerobaculia bacterium]
MMNGSRRTAAAALLLAVLVSMAAPVPAHAFDLDFGDRLSDRVETVFQRGVTTVSSLLDSIGDFLARSTATICGDG